MDQPSLEPRHDWSASEIRAIHDLSLPDLLFRAQSVHRETQPRGEVQLCTLLSIKTGGCPEDCGYCSQSSRYQTPVQAEPMLSLESVVASARRAKETGSTRFCMGAAWRDAKEGPAFERVLSMIREVKALDLEVCATLGMLNETQARKLKEAGLDAYNHNLDTSREHYRSIVSTRTYDARLETLDAVRRAGLEVCCGGILGMGESIDDRCQLLAQLASFTPHPESVPINALVPIEGTPLAELPRVDPLDMVRMIATARLVLPRSRVRLSAGRQELSREAQMLCFLAGANSIFYGDRLLTTGNPDVERDQRLLRDAGMVPMTTPV